MKLRVKSALRVAAAAVVIAAATGCMRWELQPVPQPRPSEAPARLVGTARVAPRTGQVMVLREVQVVNDTVAGWRPGTDGVLEQVKLPRSEVLTFEVRRFQLLRTVATVVVSALAVLVALGYFSDVQA